MSYSQIAATSHGQMLLGYGQLRDYLTPELGERPTLAQLRRVREQYAARIGDPVRLPGNLLGWTPGQAAAFRDILRSETRCRY